MPTRRDSVPAIEHMLLGSCQVDHQLPNPIPLSNISFTFRSFVGELSHAPCFKVPESPPGCPLLYSSPHDQHHFCRVPT